MAIRLRQKKNVALVFSGGGVKAAAFHIGVCMALREKGFRFAGGSKDHVRRAYSDDDAKTIRCYVGSSAGAFVAAILAAGYSLNALIHAFEVGLGQPPARNDNFLPPPPEPLDMQLRPIRYKDIFRLNGRGLLGSFPNILNAKTLFNGGLESLIKERFKVNGIFTTKNLEKYLRQHALIHNDFSQLGVGLYVTGTHLNENRKAVFGHFPQQESTASIDYINYAKISEAVAVSISLPPVYAPYKITRPDGHENYFYDGEIRETLSSHIAVDHGADLVISSYSLQPFHPTPEIGSLHKYGIPAILNQALYQVLHQKIESHQQHQQDIRSVYLAIDGYFKQNQLPDEHREKVLEIIRQRINYRPNVDYIYIHPKAENPEIFFADHFSLNPQILENIARIGFRSAINSLRHYDF